MNDETGDEVADLSKCSIAQLRILAIASLEHGTCPDDLTAYRITKELLVRQLDPAELRSRLRVLEGGRDE